MPIGMLLTWSGFTKEQYDKVTDILDLATKPQPGMIFHCAGQASGGWRVFDIWESQEAHDRFMKDRLSPAFEKAGIQGPGPKPEFFPIHNALVSDIKALNTRSRGVGSR
jgi:hypothetical protein